MNLFAQVFTLCAVPVVMGVLTLSLAGVSLHLRRPGWLALGFAVGMGMAGCVAFLSLVLVNRVSVGFELAALGILALLARKRAGTFALPLAELSEPRLTRLLALVLIGIAAIAAVSFVSISCHLPGGSWDAFAFWNAKARWFAQGGDTWTWIFSQPLSWLHPEYPVLLPAIVARGWKVVGQTPIVPIAVAGGFTLSTAVISFWGLRQIRGTASASLGTLLLVGSPNFILHGASQYADIPLSCFLVASTVCLAVHDAAPEHPKRMLVLAGACAGFAAFTKQEGQLFVVCLIAARAWVILRAQGRAQLWQEARPFWVGLLGPLLLLALFKAKYGVRVQGSEFYGWAPGLFAHVRHQLSDPARYSGFFASWRRGLAQFDASTIPVLALLIAYLVAAGFDPARSRTLTRTLLLTLVLEAFGVSALFLGWSTMDIRIHMDALNRVLLQHLPVVIFGVMAASRGPFLTSEPDLGEANTEVSSALR